MSRKTTQRPVLAQSEHSEQVALFQWAALQEGAAPELALLYAIPNGAPVRGGGRFVNKLKAEGLRPGVPDVCLPVARKGYHGVYIEMKITGNKPSELQEQWLDRLHDQGYLAVACWGAEDAIGVLSEYLSITP